MELIFQPNQIEIWPMSRVVPYAANAKLHGDDQVEKIAASMARFGWTVPVLVAEDGELIAGHGRILAAQRLGLQDVPVIQLAHLTEDERWATSGSAGATASPAPRRRTRSIPAAPWAG